MTLTNGETSEAFVKYAGECGLPVLDGGAAYGVATIAALKKGATVIANDADEKMLFAIAKSKDLTADCKQPNSLGAIHLSRCMHFFTPDMFEKMFDRSMKWLAPGGRLFIISMSFFHYSGEKFLPGIMERKKNGVE